MKILQIISHCQGQAVKAAHTQFVKPLLRNPQQKTKSISKEVSQQWET